MNFWIFSGVLALLACLFIILPFVYIRQNKGKDVIVPQPEIQEKENVAIYKERLLELEKELTEKLIDQEQFVQRKNELDIALLNDTKEQPAQTKQLNLRTIPSFPIVLGSAIFLVGFSFWFYLSNGALKEVEQYQSMNFDAQELQKAKKLAQDGDMSALLAQLHKKLQAAPDNIEGWQLLARSAMNVQDYVLAGTAYQEIVRIYRQNDQNPAPIIGLLAQARYYAADGVLTSDVSNLIKEAMSLDENELNSLGLLAIDAFASKRFEESKKYWLKILAVYPEHPARPSIEAGIQRVNAELGLAPEVFVKNESSLTTESKQLPVAASVNVRVSLADSIKDKVKPEDTVFIVAKQVKGNAQNPNIPLAVSRHTVAELPLEVQLDDSNSMAPIAKLSLAETVVIIARVSSSGNPIAQIGDYEAVSADISVNALEKVDLTIQSELK